MGPVQRKLPDRQAGIIVHAVDFLDVEALHQPVLHHGLAAGAALLGRLEDDDGGAGKIARLREVARSAQQHRGMAVMAAGMHLARHRRLVGNVVGFLDRERVHVGAQPDYPTALPCRTPANDADHSGAANAGHHLIAAKAAQLFGHRARGAMHVVEELRMGVQVAPPRGDVAVEIRNTVDDGHGCDPLRGAARRWPSASEDKSLAPA